ncbi:MAG: 5'-methylthioadenosine/S-adenosylhomocysteine nucleosidase, partial [Bacilli bacterium]|nr:5'-methylthioadenosine/S-adenosylhomocysteine nucleosidase [Bacilli bacterium]
MKIGIIGAMREEITFLLHKMSNIKENNYGNHIFYSGNIADNEVVVVRGGIGKVASGIVYSTLLYNYPDLELTVNVGVCGGIFGRITTGEVIVPAAVYYADVDLTYFSDYRYGQMSGCPDKFTPNLDLIEPLALPPFRTGTILSGDCFFCQKDKVQTIIDKYFFDDDVLGLDIETAALAQSAYFFKKKFIAIRVVSDL